MMFNSIYRLFVRSSRVSLATPTVRFSPFSSKAISETPNNDSFIVANYLITTFDFSEHKAFTAMKHLKATSTKNAESVIAFLKNYGFTSDQIGSIVRHFPLILRHNPHTVLMPKIDYFQSSGISPAEVNNIILTAPEVLARSTKNHIIPTFNYIKSLFSSNGISPNFEKRLAVAFRCSLESQLIPNIEILRDAGVPDHRILILLQNQPRTLMVKTEKFRETVNEVKQMNVSPCKSVFIQAVHTIRAMSKLTWEKKVMTYKKWGFSENDVSLAFKKYPHFMSVSTDKITLVMDLLVNEMELDYSFVVDRPSTLLLSSERRLKPRCSIYMILVRNGLIKKGCLVKSIFFLSERNFLKRFVHLFEKEVPGLLECYQKLQKELVVPKGRVSL